MKFPGSRSFALARLADLVSLFHASVVIIAAFGWWLMPHNVIHFIVLLATLMSWLVTGSCMLARVEYNLRKQYLATIEPYEAGYLHYHLRQVTGHAPPLPFIRRWGYIYLTCALFLWIADFLGIISMLA